MKQNAQNKNCESGDPKPYIILKQSSRHAMHSLWTSGLAHVFCRTCTLKWHGQIKHSCHPLWHATAHIAVATGPCDKHYEWHMAWLWQMELSCHMGPYHSSHWIGRSVMVCLRPRCRHRGGRPLLVRIVNLLSMNTLWMVFELTNDTRMHIIRAASDLWHNIWQTYHDTEIPQQTCLCGARSGSPQIEVWPNLLHLTMADFYRFLNACKEGDINAVVRICQCRISVHDC